MKEVTWLNPNESKSLTFQNCWVNLSHHSDIYAGRFMGKNSSYFIITPKILGRAKKIEKAMLR
jgi:hypothetical protein